MHREQQTSSPKVSHRQVQTVVGDVNTMDLTDFEDILNTQKKEIEQYKYDITKFKSQVSDLNKMITNMRTTIETLNSENEMLASENKRLLNEVCNFNLSNSVNRPIDQPERVTVRSQYEDDKVEDDKVESDMINHSERVLTKVLILTDDLGKNLYNHLRNVFDDNYKLQIVCKPNARFSDVVLNMDCYVKDFSCSDFVLVLAGVNDRILSTRGITTLANKCFHTNLVLCTIPVNYSCASPWHHIEAVNYKLHSVASNLKQFTNNIDVLDLHHKFFKRDFVNNSYYLNVKGKIKLSYYLKNIVKTFHTKKSVTNLRQIKLDLQTAPDVVVDASLVADNAIHSDNSDLNNSVFLMHNNPIVVT